MDRHHRIRLAVAHLSGESRQWAIERYLKHPEELRFKFDRRPAKRRHQKLARPISLAIRVSAEEYLEIKRQAREAGLSVSDFVRGRKITTNEEAA